MCLRCARRKRACAAHCVNERFHQRRLYASVGHRCRHINTAIGRRQSTNVCGDEVQRCFEQFRCQCKPIAMTIAIVRGLALSSNADRGICLGLCTGAIGTSGKFQHALRTCCPASEHGKCACRESRMMAALQLSFSWHAMRRRSGGLPQTRAEIRRFLLAPRPSQHAGK